MNQLCYRSVNFFTAMAEASPDSFSLLEYNARSFDESLLKERKENLKRRQRPLNILCLGITGSGKSSILNAMMGEVLARTQCVPESCQSEMECHIGQYEGIEIKAYDTVGFTGSASTDKKILKNISENAPIGGYNVVLLTLRMDCRFDEKVFQMLSLAGKLLKTVMWQRTIVVLTFANAFIVQLEEGYQGYSLNTDVQKMTIERTIAKIKELFQKHTRLHKDITSTIPIVLAGSANKRDLPIDSDWLSTLWDNVIYHCKYEQKSFLKPSLFKRITKSLHSQRFESNSEELTEENPSTDHQKLKENGLEAVELQDDKVKDIIQADNEDHSYEEEVENDSENDTELPSLQLDDFFTDVLDKMH
uniref:AIG1-type G domain-containing protein n=1 Tax=Amphimedon queenslandica TaxID=400682 RepID=A0A1X7UMV6_AMPQE